MNKVRDVSWPQVALRLSGWQDEELASPSWQENEGTSPQLAFSPPPSGPVEPKWVINVYLKLSWYAWWIYFFVLYLVSLHQIFRSAHRGLDLIINAVDLGCGLFNFWLENWGLKLFQAYNCQKVKSYLIMNKYCCLWGAVMKITNLILFVKGHLDSDLHLCRSNSFSSHFCRHYCWWTCPFWGHVSGNLYSLWQY